MKEENVHIFILFIIILVMSLCHSLSVMLDSVSSLCLV